MSGTILLALRILIAAALYAFLLLALNVLWRELRRAGTEPGASQLPELTLTLEGDTPPRNFVFKVPEVIIGRDPTCNLRLDDKTISARHVRLSYHHRQWWVEDLNSTNGAFLNAEPLKVAAVIADGDHLSCGSLDFEIRLQT